MLITTSEHIAQACVKKAPNLATVVEDRTRPISMDADIARQLGFAVGPPVKVTPHFILRGLDLGDLPTDEMKALNDLVRKASDAIFDDIKAAHPLLGGGLDGYELIVAAAGGYKAWTDPKGVSVAKAGAATAKAMKEALQVLNRVVPGLAANPHTGTAILVLSAAGKVFQLCAELSPDPSPDRIELPGSFRAA